MNAIKGLWARGAAGKIVVSLSGLAIGCCACSMLALIIPTPRQQRAEATVIAAAATVEKAVATPAPTETATAEAVATLTPAPAATERPSPTETPAPTEPPAPTSLPAGGGNLPGLQPADVVVNLEQRGFTCTNAEPTATGNYYTWTCKNQDDALGIDAIVTAWGRTLRTVDLIDATVIQAEGSEDIVAKALLGFVATMPYDNADPANARQWVEDTLATIREAGDVRETEFAGVAYRLYGPNTARNLEMGKLEEE
jgi:hypothetical protein